MRANNRWVIATAGVFLQIALGAVYAWSVFRAPLAKQFGWTPATVKIGTRITLIGRRVKTGAPYMNLTERANIVLTDSGKEIFRTPNFGEPPAPPAPPPPPSPPAQP